MRLGLRLVRTTVLQIVKELEKRVAAPCEHVLSTRQPFLS